MANSDKNILITPNVGAATGTNPTIRFTGADNTPITLRVLDNGTVSFEGTAGQLFSVSDGLTGSIFSVNDISGIPSIEVLDTGLVKLNQYNGQTTIGTSAAITSGGVPAMLSIVNRTATTQGIAMRAAPAATASMLEFQNSALTVVASIAADGAIRGNFFTNTTNTNPYVDSSGGSFIVLNRTNTANTIFGVRGMASQSGDLQVWQNNTPSTLSRVDAFGRFGIRTAVIGSSSLSVMPDATTSVAQTIRANTSQTANIQEWQTSTPTTVTWVDQNAVLNTSNLATSNNQVANKLYVDNAIAASTTVTEEIIPLDDISSYFDDRETRFSPLYQGTLVSITNPLRLLLTINGIIQYVDFPDYVWMSGLPRRGFFVDSDGQLQFSEPVPAGSEFDARIMSGNATTTRTRIYPFKAVDILLGG
jgi:hypothetical protein